MDIKAAILASSKKHLQKVPVPEWGVDVFLRTMTAGERDAWEVFGCRGAAAGGAGRQRG